MREPRQNDWRVTLVLFAFTSFVESMGFGHLSAFTPLYLHHLGVRASSVPFWTGIGGTIGAVGFPLVPFWGAWAERYGRKAIIVRSAVLDIAIYLLTSLVTGPLQLTLVRMLGGFSMGNTGVMMAIQSEITPPERLGLAVASIGAGPALAVALGPLFGGFIVASGGIRQLFRVDSVVAVIATVLLLVFLREGVWQRSGERVGSIAKRALSDVVGEPAIRHLFIVFALFAVASSMSLTFLPIWLEKLDLGGGLLGHLPPSEMIGTVLGVAGVAMAVTTPLLGALGDRFGAMPSLRVALFGNAAGLLGQAFAQSLDQAASGRIGQGLFQGGIRANVTTLLARTTPPERRSSVMNLSILPMQISYFAGPALGTALAGALGIRGMLITSAALALVGAFLGLRALPAVRAPATARGEPT